MRFYDQSHEFTRGVDLHGRAMYACVLDRGSTEDRTPRRSEETPGLSPLSSPDRTTLPLARARSPNKTGDTANGSFEIPELMRAR